MESGYPKPRRGRGRARQELNPAQEEGMAGYDLPPETGFLQPSTAEGYVPEHQGIPPDQWPIVEVPAAVEEIVLNRRGMPARQRKKNRYYFDDEMITDDAQYRATKKINKAMEAEAKLARKVKQEVVEEEEIEGISIRAEPVDYGRSSSWRREEPPETAEADDSSPERRRRDTLLMPPPPAPRPRVRTEISGLGPAPLGTEKPPHVPRKLDGRDTARLPSKPLTEDEDTPPLAPHKSDRTEITHLPAAPLTTEKRQRRPRPPDDYSWDKKHSALLPSREELEGLDAEDLARLKQEEELSRLKKEKADRRRWDRKKRSGLGSPTAAQVAMAVSTIVQKPKAGASGEGSRPKSKPRSSTYAGRPHKPSPYKYDPSNKKSPYTCDPNWELPVEAHSSHNIPRIRHVTFKQDKVHKKHKEKRGRSESSRSERYIDEDNGHSFDLNSGDGMLEVGPMDPLALDSDYDRYDDMGYQKNKPHKEHRHKQKEPLRSILKGSRAREEARPQMTDLEASKIISRAWAQQFESHVQPGTSGAPGIDKKTAHGISIRLRNLLKLPKAHKWVCYEWFYSNIDKVLFEGENDFQICLKESFPLLKCTNMAHFEWVRIRRMMGKPRRCSQAFFEEEREELQRRRQKIRMIQQRKITDFNYKELPDEIPLQLVIGTKVTARLRKQAQDGLYTGTIEAVDTSNNTYRITFDRPGLGTHSIADNEVLSNDPPETVTTSSFAMKIPRRSYGGGSGFKLASALTDEMSGFPKSPFPADGMLGGFPIRLLDMIVRLSKLLKGKRERISHLKELNVEAEKMISYGRELNEDYRIRYSRCVLDLDSMNKEMSVYLDAIQRYCIEITLDGPNRMIIPEGVREDCRTDALMLVDGTNKKRGPPAVHGPRTLTLIANLTSLLFQVKHLSTEKPNLYEIKSIKDSMKEIQASLDGKNVQLFQDAVEIPMNRIQAGLTMN